MYKSQIFEKHCDDKYQRLSFEENVSTSWNRWKQQGQKFIAYEFSEVFTGCLRLQKIIKIVFLFIEIIFYLTTIVSSCQYLSKTYRKGFLL